jgi:hypothetical protein
MSEAMAIDRKSLDIFLGIASAMPTRRPSVGKQCVDLSDSPANVTNRPTGIAVSEI